MNFAYETLDIGGEIIIPDSMISSKPGRISSKTRAGIYVQYVTEHGHQSGFYSYDWLNQTYGDVF